MQIFEWFRNLNPSGSASGFVEGLDEIWSILESLSGTFDAVAISSVIEVPPEYHTDYYELAGEMINPWGGVEAMLTHAVSLKYGIPAAHSPMFESRDIAQIDVGVVDPRMAAEVISETFFQSVLRGLQHSPRISNAEIAEPGGVGIENVSCLVIPDGCLGLPTLAALYQGVTVIAVGENRNIMRNKLSRLPWRHGQLITVGSYLEAAGALAALRAGLEPNLVRRPIAPANVRHHTAGALAHGAGTHQSRVRST